jgi:hypothetical protein
MFCLPPELGDKFLNAIREGKVNPDKLSGMTSDGRRKFFSDLLGEENAKDTNALFEAKLLLKNKQLGYTTWARQVAGLKPEVRRDLVSRIGRMDTRIFDPGAEEAFLKDLASAKLGADVTVNEAKSIAGLSQKVTDTKTKMKADFTFASEEQRLAHGRAIVALTDYAEGLKDQASRLGLRALTSREAIIHAPSRLAGLAKSLKATLDNSVIGRQGLKVLMTHPTVWGRNSLKTFTYMWKEFGGKSAMAEVRADVYSRPNALNGLYQKEKLAIGVVEEAYPTSAPGKVPGLGRIFKGSESAFEGFQFRTRADLFDKYAEIVEKSGGDITGVGKLANSLTGRGNLRGWEPVGNKVNNLFFSPRLMKSNVDGLTAHVFDNDMGKVTGKGFQARRRAALNTVKIISGVATILSIADAVHPGSVDFDPRSANFGKIKIKDTTFDVSGGAGSIITLAARLASQSKKSAKTGEVTSLGTKFAQDSGEDVVQNFFTGKLSPAAAVINDIFIRHADYQGNPITPGGEAGNLLAPLPITNYFELKRDPNSAGALAGVLADSFGVSTNTIPGDNKEKRVYRLPGGPNAKQGIIESVATYAKAFGTSPTTTFDRIFSGQRILEAHNGAIIVERMPVEKSQEVKSKRKGNTRELKLDHTVPLELGGSNNADNLRLVPTKTWKEYSPIENYLGRKLKSGDLSAKEVTDLITRFKKGKISADDVRRYKHK